MKHFRNVLSIFVLTALVTILAGCGKTANSSKTPNDGTAEYHWRMPFKYLELPIVVGITLWLFQFILQFFKDLIKKPE
mgnify:CR=1 FL=1